MYVCMYTYVCMYLCMYYCMYVYVCVYICMYVYSYDKVTFVLLCSHIVVGLGTRNAITKVTHIIVE